jgi:uncharacterized membrane protein (DUF4010 family)
MVLQAEFIKMLIIAALVGGLVGIEREMKEKVVAGMRTFMLASILGALSVVISDALEEELFLIIAFFGILLVTLLLGIIKNINLWDIGVTTPVAFLLTFLLGVLAGMQMYFEAVAGSVIITGILVTKKYSTSFSKTLTHSEIINALEFGIIAFVLYPVVPDYPVDPFGLINPRMLVLIVIVVTSIGFAGFLALRQVGVEKGLPIVGALGGLVNSEATTSALAIKAKKYEELVQSAKTAIVYTNCVMLARNLVIAGVISIEVLRFMVLPQVLMIAAGLLYSATAKYKEKPKEMETPVESPFAILPAIRFALLFTAISIIVDTFKDYGVGGVYITAMLGGLVSSAAVTASLASLGALGSLDAYTAASGCVIAAVGSTLGKILIVRISGTKDLLKIIGFPSTLMAVVGIVVLVLQSAI